ncbi:MAG: hypothetical protein JRI22_00335 [Deltaproteobacteria bacterium]|nr:hypothetical protein [Deltaproteobacteria bacterium]
MIDWNYALRLFIISIGGTFAVMSVLTAIMSIVSKIFELKQKQKKADS